MKEFCKWLGVNEKIAKIVVWIMLTIVFLILTNILLDSLNFPHYKITYENISKINTNVILDYLSSWIIGILNFFTIVLLIFDFKKIKKILPFSILYLLGNVIIYELLGYVVAQIYIFVYVTAFCYFFSGKQKKYILYSLASIIFNAFMQYIFFALKLNLIDIPSISIYAKNLLGIDYLIVMIVTIFIKELYIRKKLKINIVKTNKASTRKNGIWFNDSATLDNFAVANAGNLQKLFENIIFYSLYIPIQLIQTAGVIVIAYINNAFPALTFFLVGFFFTRSLLGETFHLASPILCTIATWILFYLITWLLPSIYISVLLSLILGCGLSIVLNYLVVRNEVSCRKDLE